MPVDTLAQPGYIWSVDNLEKGVELMKVQSNRSISLRLSILARIPAILLILSVSGCGDDPPTGTKSSPVSPAGILVGHTDCKHLEDIATAPSFPLTSSCIEYDYDGQGVLSLKHVNAGFNCCPGEIVAEIIIENSTIIIKERELAGLCDCLCLFDVDYSIENLEPDEYTIIVVEPYLPDGNNKLEFTVDLNANPVGAHCVKRQGYPWGT